MLSSDVAPLTACTSTRTILLPATGRRLLQRSVPIRGWVFKTLVTAFAGGLANAVIPVSTELDLKAMAAALGVKKVTMAQAVMAERATGYVVGGISPLGQRRRLPTIVDESAPLWPTVFVSGGRRGLEIELTPADLVALTGASLVQVAAPRRDKAGTPAPARSRANGPG